MRQACFFKKVIRNAFLLLAPAKTNRKMSVFISFFETMGESKNKQNSDGNDGANRRQVLRGEDEWRELLNRADRETARFLEIYEASFLLPVEEQENGDRLDRCAVTMGWHLSEDADDAADAPDDFSSNENDADPASQDAANAEFPPVYSLHNLPECIAISALFRFARARIATLVRSGTLRAFSAERLAETLADAYRDMLIAVDAEDALEFGLSICLMKNAHAAINRNFAEMEQLPPPRTEKYARIVRELRCAMMDLRDMCLRIIRDAREEAARHADDPADGEKN